jgi:hypothetical protein
MSRDDTDAPAGEAADEASDGDPSEAESVADEGETVTKDGESVTENGETVPEDSADASTGRAGMDQNGQTETPQGPADRDEFGLASDLATGRSGANEDLDDPREFAVSGESPSEDGADGDAPLSSLASSVSDRRTDTAERHDDELFDEEDVPEIDAEAVWERLGEDEPPEVPDDTEHDVRVIEKRSYCEQCPFFSTPPDVGCDHEGTEILELVDMDHFRVVDCPKVLEDERLERL